jgi:hypothetical protein
VNGEIATKKIVICEFDTKHHWGFHCRFAYYPTSSVAMLTEYGSSIDNMRLEVLNHLCDHLRKDYKLSFERTIWIERVCANPEALITNDDCFNLIRVHDENGTTKVSGWHALSWDEVESVVQPVWPELFLM